MITTKVMDGMDEWAFVAPYVTLMSEDAPQRTHPLREIFHGLRWMARAGVPWRMMPNGCRHGRRWISRPSVG
jgi:transposase